MRGHLAVVLVLAAFLLSGCQAPVDPGQPAEDFPNGSNDLPITSQAETEDEEEKAPQPGYGSAPHEVSPEPFRGEATLREDGRIHLNITLPMVLIGFQNGTGEAVQERFEPVLLDRSKHGNHHPRVPDDGSTPLDWTETVIEPLPFLYEVHVDVIEADDAFTAEFLQWLPEATLESGSLDGEQIERWFYEQLAEDGLVREGMVSLVALHLAGLDQTGGISYSDAVRTHENVRIFGTQYPVLVFEASAPRDQGASGGSGLYAGPLPDGGDETADGLAAFATEAVQWRVFSRVLGFAPSGACHSITLILAHRATSLVPVEPDVDHLVAEWEDLFRPESIEIHVKRLSLPVDDPALDLVLRGELALAPHGARAYLHANWDQYVETGLGCEEYLAVFVQGDSLDRGSGSGSTDAGTERRIALMSVPQELVNVYPEAFPTYLLAHEMGHLFGLVHVDQGHPGSNTHFQHVHSVIHDGIARMFIEYGAGDRINILRERAGAVVERGLDEGLADLPGFEDVLDDLAEFRWADATTRTLALLEGQNPDSGMP
jgi:hypothetical protein